jgi:cell division protein FtsA
MKDKELIVGLDIGGTAVRIAVGALSFTEKGERKINILAAVSSPCEGMHRGVITSIDDVVSSISNCVDKTERILGMPIERVWVGISGSHIISRPAHGVVGIAKPDGEITENDISRVLEDARTTAIPSNYEILHVIPKSFTVDNQTGISDPLGMNALRLEVDAEIIQGLSSQIRNLTKCIYRARLEIENLVFSILAAAEAVLTSKQKEVGTALINIGASTTSMAVFEERNVIHTAVLPVGSEHITSDIAIGLRTSIDIAEQVKIDYGTANSKIVNKREEINLRECGAVSDEFVSRKYVAEIIEARVEEILEKIDDELKKIARSGLLPGGVVLTGGGAKLPGLVEVAKRKLRLPASLGYSTGISGTTDKINDLGFTTAIGLVLWGAAALSDESDSSLHHLLKPFVKSDGFWSKIKKIFSSFFE